MVMADDIILNIGCGKGESDWGVSDVTGRWGYYRSVMVEGDGTVRAYDELAEHYSIHHDLSPSQVETARSLAAMVRAGTHYVSAGFVVKRS